MGNRVLLVEDHQDTANVFARMLRRDGFEVSIATTCAQAAGMFGQGAFDLLICDINLPDGDGAHLLTAARKIHPDTVGIIISGHDEESLLARAREAGFSHCFLKPIDYPALRETLSRTIAEG